MKIQKLSKNEKETRQDFFEESTVLCPQCGARLTVQAVGLFDIEVKNFEICKCGFDFNITETPF